MTKLPAQFYPIALDYPTAELYIKSGIKFLQIRLKDMPHNEIKNQLSHAIALAKTHNVALVVNDYWEYALDYKADWIHLGQEDLEKSDMQAINQANIKFGLSTHDTHELDTALDTNPHYIALGPVYFTKLKAMKWKPQGLDVVKQWKQKCGLTPLVAIGGITFEKAQGVLSAGADCVSFVTDITHHDIPQQRLNEWIKHFTL